MNFITSLLGNLNYGTILFLMMLESTVIPVPSELVVAPAAYHAAGGNLNIILVIIAATLGADLGATINYVAAYYLGRPIPHLYTCWTGKNALWQVSALYHSRSRMLELHTRGHGMVSACHCARKPTGCKD